MTMPASFSLRPTAPRNQTCQPLLSADEELALARAVAAGDEAARDRLIGANLGLVVVIAKDYVGRGLGLDDLVGEGNLGLVRAADRFDRGVGARFATYASHWIRQAIRRALSETTATVRLPSYMVKLVGRWRRAERRLAAELGRPPAEAEIAERLGPGERQLERVREALRIRRAEPAGPMEFRDRGRTPEELAGAADERRMLRLRLDRLDDRGRDIVAARYGLGDVAPMQLHEIGRRWGVTREWARKLELRALRALAEM
jgi:RNA polymerase primary sigma factor